MYYNLALLLSITGSLDFYFVPTPSFQVWRMVLALDGLKVRSIIGCVLWQSHSLLRDTYTGSGGTRKGDAGVQLAQPSVCHWQSAHPFCLNFWSGKQEDNDAVLPVTTFQPLQRSQLSKSLGRESVRALCLCGGRVQTSEQGRLHISCVLCLICRKFPEKHLWENSPRRCFLWGPGSAFKPPISEREKGGQLPCAKDEGYLVSPAYSNESTDP